MRSDHRGRHDGPVIEVTERDAAIVVRLGGEIELHTASPVRRALLDAVGRAPGRVVVDLTEVEFMDSTALAILVEARARLADADNLVLAAPGLEARRALEISGLDRILRVCASVEDALAAV
jgi:anti-sigma B factor antagonist